jgi:hypothetical protein
MELSSTMRILRIILPGLFRPWQAFWPGRVLKLDGYEEG